MSRAEKMLQQTPIKHVSYQNWRITCVSCGKITAFLKVNMGNAQQVAGEVIKNPLPEERVRSVAGDMVDSKVQQWILSLLSGTTPTNFNYDDILTNLHQYTDDRFIILPVWTLLLRSVDTSAACFVKNWPVWTEEQLTSPTFLASVRVMFPLFKMGHPIGHARFMFYDNWTPMPVDSIVQEEQQWLQMVQEVLPVKEVATLIVIDYQGLCPSRAQGGQHQLKIIDSLPGNTKTFGEDVQDFEKVIALVLDPTWTPPDRKGCDMEQKLRCVRTFLSAVHSSETTQEHMLLPSTIQTGLECIIISICRVIATWVRPEAIPLIDCTSLCQDKRGRRILATLLLVSYRHKLTAELDMSQDNIVDASASVAHDATDAVPVLPAAAPGVDPPSSTSATWCIVYACPTFQILARDSDYVPQPIMFNDRLGYTIYRNCKWVHLAREQDFTAGETILATNGKLGCLFICPIKDEVKRRWNLLVLSHKGMTMIDAAGPRKDKGRVVLQDATLVCPDLVWECPTWTPADIDAFVDTLEDSTFKLLSMASTRTSSSPTSDSERDDSTLRRSRRTPKPVKRLTTPVQTRVYSVYVC